MIFNWRVLIIFLVFDKTIVFHDICLIVAFFWLATSTRTILAAGLKETHEKSGSPFICNGIQDNGRILHITTDAQSTWICKNGIPTAIKQTSKLSLQDMARGATNDDVLFKCPTSGIHRFVLEGSCTQYISCIAGRYSIQSCVHGLHFDSVLLGCNYKNKANCDRDWCPPVDSIDTIVTRPSKNSCEE